jgi:hypothetical protein
LRAEAHRVAGMINPMYQAALEKDCTMKMHNEMRITAVSELNEIISLFGPSGSGKSFVIADLVEDYLNYFDPPKKISIDNVFFTVTDMLEAIETVEKGSVVWLDEQIFTSGYGSTVEKRNLQNIESTVRAHKLSFFFSAPQFIQHNFHYYMETWQMGSDEPWPENVGKLSTENIKGWIHHWKYTKSIVYSEKGHMMGYIVTRTPDDKAFLSAYQKKKDKFVTDVRAQKGGQRFMVIERRAHRLLEKPEFLSEFCSTRDNKLRQLACEIHSGGIYMGIQDWRTLVSYIDREIQVIHPDKYQEYLNLRAERGRKKS